MLVEIEAFLVSWLNVFSAIDQYSIAEIGS